MAFSRNFSCVTSKQIRRSTRSATGSSGTAGGWADANKRSPLLWPIPTQPGWKWPSKVLTFVSQKAELFKDVKMMKLNISNKKTMQRGLRLKVAAKSSGSNHGCKGDKSLETCDGRHPVPVEAPFDPQKS